MIEKQLVKASRKAEVEPNKGKQQVSRRNRKKRRQQNIERITEGIWIAMECEAMCTG